MSLHTAPLEVTEKVKILRMSALKWIHFFKLNSLVEFP